MPKIDFTISHWFAWMPGLETQEDWIKWAKNEQQCSDDFTLCPDVSFISATHRRRLSQLTKMMLKTAFECGKNYQNLESVFASRYGELEQTIKLLNSLTTTHEISPAGFSLSVHNTAAGINSIINNNKAPYTAIAGCETTFETAIIEAVGRLKNNERILMVYGDEYVEEFKKNAPPIALALVIERNGNKKISAEISPQKNQNNENTSLKFIEWLINQDASSLQTSLLIFNSNVT